jgi:DNA-binding XRE family transcriptional regulator
MTINGTYPNKLNDLIPLTGKTKADMARYCDVQRQAVSNWVTGRSMPNRFVMPKVLEFLSVPFEQPLTVGDVWEVR